MIFENSERSKALEKFRYLWRLDDSEWVNKRKEHWKILVQSEFNDCPAPEIKKYKTYYLNGERDSYIPGSTLFLLTPLRSPEVAYEFVYSNVFDEQDRLISSFLNVTANSKIPMKLLRPHVLLYSEAILGKEYKVIEVKDNNVTKIAPPDPSSWAGSYFVHTRNFFKDREKEYSPVVDLLDYFISSLKFADSPKHLPKKHMETLMTIIESEYAESDPRPIAQEFLRALRLRKGEILESWNKNSHLFK